MCRRCGKPAPCPQPACPPPSCPPPTCANPYPKEPCYTRLGCKFFPRRNPCPPEPCPQPPPCAPGPCTSRRPCSPGPCTHPPEPCPSRPCSPRPCSPKPCSQKPCSPKPSCSKPCRQKKCPPKKCQPPPCNQPCPPQPCTSCCEKKPCSKDPSDHCPPRCSNPCDPPCLPPCPPREICCPERRCYFARNCCCGAYMSKYICGATPDTVIMDAIDGLKDVMGYLEECADDPEYYKPGVFSEPECAEHKERRKMLKECRKRVECEPICIVPPDRCEPPC